MRLSSFPIGICYFLNLYYTIFPFKKTDTRAEKILPVLETGRKSSEPLFIIMVLLISDMGIEIINDEAQHNHRQRHNHNRTGILKTDKDCQKPQQAG